MTPSDNTLVEEKMTDKRVIGLALRLAIMWEESLLNTGQKAVDEEATKKNIKALKRVQLKYFGIAPNPFKGAKLIDAMKLPTEYRLNTPIERQKT